MNPYDAYVVYISIKLHFEQHGYNAFKYNFKTRAPYESFLKRNDRYQFEKLARKYPNKNDLIAFYVSNWVQDKTYVGDMEDDVYLEWTGKISRSRYLFQKEISDIWGNEDLSFKEAFIKDSGDYPRVLKKLIRHDISLESVVLLNKLLKLDEHWPDFDPIVWPELKLKIQKYAYFVPFNHQKYFELFEKIIGSRL